MRARASVSMVMLLSFFMLFGGTFLYSQGSANSLQALLDSLGPEWKVNEYFKPQWDYQGSWTREGQTNVYRAVYRNLGTSSVKQADFRVTAESYENGLLKIRSLTEPNKVYTIPVKPGSRQAAASDLSWCRLTGCGVQFTFPGGSPAPPVTGISAALLSLLDSLGPAWKVNEYLKPQWDWQGTWTREGQTNVYRVVYRNLGTDAAKQADFRVRAESYENGLLKIRSLDDPNRIITLPVKPGSRQAAASDLSWCRLTGCGLQFAFQESSPPPSGPLSLTGAWVHSAEGTTQTPDSKVIVMHEGNQVTLLGSYKMAINRNQWQTYLCVGPLNGQDLQMACRWVEGGNPMGYADHGTLYLRLSADSHHLSGYNVQTGKRGQDFYFSRVQ